MKSRRDLDQKNGTEWQNSHEERALRRQARRVFWQRKFWASRSASASGRDLTTDLGADALWFSSVGLV
jgi:hypothetical protein